MTDTPDALLPCPLCGGSAEIERQGTMRQSMIIACTNCGCSVESGDVFGMTKPENYRWNTRPTPSGALELARRVNAHDGRHDQLVNWKDVAQQLARALLAGRPQESARAHNAIVEIAAERKRQVEAEGWSVEHDDQHDEEQLAKAAICYAAPDWLRKFFEANDIRIWPWDLGWWKPKSRRRDLIRAAALLVAEIERLDRLSAEGGERA